MTFVAAKCPQCSGSLQVPDDRDVVKCMYCGVDVIVRQAIRAVAGDSKNLLELAQAASSAGNHGEAYQYFTKVLEVDPTNAEAWFGKGSAAGWQSTLSSFRFGEMMVAYDKAISLSTDQSQTRMREACALSQNSVATACYALSRQHMLEFVALPDTWQDYIPRCRQVLDLLQSAQALAPDNQQIIENIILVCQDNIEGVTFNDPYDNDAPKGWHLSTDYEAEIRSILTDYAERLRQLNPEYVAPNPVAKKPSACFVVTAALNDEQHPSVVFLREFRDEELSRSKIGRSMIAFYARHGPTLAQGIRGSRVARGLARVLVVAPAVAIVRVFKRLR
jgi:tetratricopeptide (TPR) repeat protein